MAHGGADCWGVALKTGRLTFLFPMESLEFSIDIILPAALWYWVDSGSNRNEPQEYFWGCKVGLCVQLTTLLPSCAGCLEIRQPAPPGTLSRPVMWLLYPYWETHLRYACVPYLLTYSMVQSPSWEANWFAASQEIPHILWNPKVHYRTHKRPPPVPILGQPNPLHIPTSHLLEIHPNIIHPSTPRSPQWSMPVYLSTGNCVCACCSHNSQLDKKCSRNYWK